MRNAFKKEKSKEIENLKLEHQLCKNDHNVKELQSMKTTVQTHIENIGSGHQSATNYDDLGRQEIQFQKLYEDNQVAKLRGQFALNQHYEQKKQKGSFTYYRISTNYSHLFPEKCAIF